MRLGVDQKNTDMKTATTGRNCLNGTPEVVASDTEEINTDTKTNLEGEKYTKQNPPTEPIPIISLKFV